MAFENDKLFTVELDVFVKFTLTFKHYPINNYDDHNYVYE